MRDREQSVLVTLTGNRSHSQRRRLAEPERLRERIGYLKFWQGVVVVTDISLIGWLLSPSDHAMKQSILAFTSIVVLSFGMLHLHRRIDRRIEQIGTV